MSQSNYLTNHKQSEADQIKHNSALDPDQPKKKKHKIPCDHQRNK